MITSTNRSWLVFLAVLILVCSSAEQAKPQQVMPVILDGRVLRQGNSEAIPKAQITLIQLNPNLPMTKEAIALVQSVAKLMQYPNATAPGFIEGFLNPNSQAINVPPEVVRPLSVSSALSDETGSFRFNDLPAGRYVLTAQREGYYAPPSGDDSGETITRIVVVRSGEVPASIELRMVKGGAISGQIHDLSGQLVPGITVEPYQLSYPNGTVALEVRATTFSNENGKYLFSGLRPGQYFIGVLPKVMGYLADPDRVRTFYPGTVDPMAAQEVTIREGEEVKGIDITIRKSTSGKYKISGIAINSRPNVSDKSISAFYLVPRVSSLTDGTRLSAIMNVLPAASRAHGEFEIRDVEPGLYDLYPLYMDIKSKRYFTSRTPIEIRNGDIEDLSLSLNDGSTLAAELVFSGTSSPLIKMDALRMNLTIPGSPGLPFASIMGSLPFDAEGKLQVENVTEATYAVSVAGMPAAAYISDIRQGDRSIYDEGVVVGKVSVSIQIQVDLSGATVAGIVEAADGTPAANVSVILIPPIERRRNRALFKVVSTNNEGRFSMTGVMLGTYTLLALHDHPPREPWLNADFLATYQDRAQPITVSSGTASNIKLGLTSN
jgi:hypothetical protein